MTSPDKKIQSEQQDDIAIIDKPVDDNVVKSKADDKVPLKPPDGGYGWWIVVGAAITHFCLVGLARTLGVVYIVLKTNYGGTDVQTAWVAAIFNTCRSLFAPIASVLCERLSCRLVTMVGTSILVIGFLASAFASHLFHLYITFGFAGIGGAMVFTPAYIMVGKYFDKRKGKAMAFATLGSGLGSIALAPTVNVLLHHYTYFGTMIIVAGLELNHMIAGILYKPLRQNKQVPAEIKGVKGVDEHKQGKVIGKNESHFENKSEIHHEKESETSRKTEKPAELVFCEKPLLEPTSDNKMDKGDSRTNMDSGTLRMKISQLRRESIYCNGTFFLYCIVVMSMQVCIQTYLIFLPGFALEKGAPDRQAALVLSVFGFSDMGGRFLFGFLFDLKQIRKRRRDFFCIISGIFGALVILMCFMSNFILVCVLAGITGLFEGATHSQRTTVLSEFVTSSQMSTAVGITIFFQGLGNIYGPPLGGLLSDISGTNAYAFVFCGSMMLASSVMFLLQNWIWNKRCQCKS